MRVALATCRAARGRDPDEPLLLDALAARGAAARACAWDDPGVDWAAFDVVCVRSTWDYPPRRAAFLAWAAAVAGVTRLINPLAVLAWSTDKAYLGELAAAGLPVVPTTELAPGPGLRLPERGEFVVKPRIGAGAVDALRADQAPAARLAAARLAARLLAAGRGAIAQPYLEEVDRAGETALVYLGGAFSHAVRKGPLLAPGAAPAGGLFAAEEITARVPAPAEHAVAERVMGWLAGRHPGVAYARVDLLPAPGGPCLLELELAEPSLFLAEAPGAAGRLAAALCAG